MKVYNKDGVSMTVAKEQIEDVLASDCWFKIKPELKKDASMKLAAEKDEAADSKPKKIRKVTPKKK